MPAKGRSAMDTCWMTLVQLERVILGFYEKNGFVKKRTTTVKVRTREVPTQVLGKRLE
jgi:hypothetical protein